MNCWRGGISYWRRGTKLTEKRRITPGVYCFKHRHHLPSPQRRWVNWGRGSVMSSAVWLVVVVVVVEEAAKTLVRCKQRRPFVHTQHTKESRSLLSLCHIGLSSLDSLSLSLSLCDGSIPPHPNSLPSHHLCNLSLCVVVFS